MGCGRCPWRGDDIGGSLRDAASYQAKRALARIRLPRIFRERTVTVLKRRWQAHPL